MLESLCRKSQRIYEETSITKPKMLLVNDEIYLLEAYAL